MELSNQAIHDVIHPTAIFCAAADRDGPNHRSNDGSDLLWADSQLNPKNRVDSLDPPKDPLWRIDGCAGLGTHFYAVPLFLGDVPPMRFDVLVSENAVESPTVRKLLNMDMVFHARDHVRLQRQGICSYVLRALQAWTMRGGSAQVRQLYRSGPFGSRIVFCDLPFKVENVNIRIAQNHDLERRHKSVDELAQLWQATIKSMPPTVDIQDLVYVKQLHDSVCVVRYLNDDAIEKTGLWVLKALTSSVKYMYHELRVLLTMPPHPNIVSAPKGLVTKPNSLVPKRQNVVGFLVPFHSGGGLRDELPILRLTNSLQIQDQARYAVDICSALLHIQDQAQTFYPDLRLDQIVFPADRKRPILVDFEQRGVWCEFAAPEINAIEYLMTLATDEYLGSEEEPETAGSFEFGLDGSWPSLPRLHDIVDRLHPDTRKLRNPHDQYDNPSAGYNVPWLHLSRKEQEYAEVYMLGRLLWCIFEGMSAPQQGAIWQSYRNEPEFDFPEFRRTPSMLRPYILRCTQGRRSQLSSHVIRKGSKIALRDDPRGDGTAEEIKAVAKDFWTNEVRWAEDFLLSRETSKAEGTWEDNHFGRPRLQEVYGVLRVFQEMMDS
ncbi:unnamed protein product [Discula destructiva]